MAALAELTFEVDRGDVLATRGDDRILLAAGDREEAIWAQSLLSDRATGDAPAGEPAGASFLGPGCCRIDRQEG